MINVHRSSCNVPLYLLAFNETWILSTDFLTFLKYQVSRKYILGSRVVSCGQSDRRTDVKLTVAYRSVANAQTTISTKQSPSFNGIWKFANIFFIGPYFESVECIPHPHTPFFKNQISIILLSKSRTSKWSLTFRFVDYYFQISYFLHEFCLFQPRSTSWCKHPVLSAWDFKLWTYFTTNWWYCCDWNIGDFRLWNATLCGLVIMYQSFIGMLPPQVSPRILIYEST